MIKIEVTGASIGEVADKLLAIGANLKGNAIVEGARAAVNAMQVMNPIMPEVAEAGVAVFSAPHPVNNTPVPEDIAPEALEVVEVEVAEQAADPEPTPPASASDELDFDTDVAPWVLRVVKEKGKPAAQEILSQFGVEKASLLDPAQWPELVSVLKEAL